jgi:hypothetical protein
VVVHQDHQDRPAHLDRQGLRAHLDRQVRQGLLALQGRPESAVRRACRGRLQDPRGHPADLAGSSARAAQAAVRVAAGIQVAARSGVEEL